MSQNSNIHIFFVTVIFTCTIFSATSTSAAMDPRFELDPQSLAGTDKSKPTTQKSKGIRSSRRHIAKSVANSAKGVVYTVQPGDHLFKILMRDYGLHNDEAESYIEEIKRENNIYDIKRLKIGQKIILPPVRRHTDGTLQKYQIIRADNTQSIGSETVPVQSFKLESLVTSLSEQEAVARVQEVWKRIVPPKVEQQKPLSIKTATFSLTLDPERYPAFSRMDGGRIVLDQNGTIPPLVKSLIEDKDSSVRIVTETPTETKRFMASLLEAAGFFSVEENFSMEFGIDPKFTVQADFKVEKSAESLLKQDIVLVNSRRTSFPTSLGDFLKKEGFSLYEPFASQKPFAQRDSRTIHYISAKNQNKMIDAILSAFSVSYERDRRVDVFSADNNGVSLSMNTERFFERGGQRFVITSFDGDPINYTLFRILETKGYNVVILEAQDDFRKISEKIISRLNMKGMFAQHSLLKDKSVGYSLQISGFNLDDSLLPGGGIFLTDRPMDRIVRDIFTENGFNIINQ
jgi:hypothetical protein